jgi:hypothetical protein
MLYDDFKGIQNSLLPRQDDFGGSKRVLYPDHHALNIYRPASRAYNLLKG